MKRVQLLAHLDGVARVRAALKSHDDVGAIGEEIDDFPLAFVPELGTDNDRRGHPNRRRNIASGLMVLYRRHDGHSRWRFPSAGRRAGRAAVDLARYGFIRSRPFWPAAAPGREGGSALSQATDKIPTYVIGLDDRLSGGIPRGHIVLVAGPPGSLQSSFVYRILFYEAQEHGASALDLST